MSEVALKQRRYRHEIPKQHRNSLDTRLVWLWRQRYGTVQTIWRESPDLLDNTACSLVLQAIIGKNLGSISLLFQRIEGGAVLDETLAAQDTVLRF